MYSETWPHSGTTQNGIAYQRFSSVPLIYVTESGLWPTPRAIDGRPKGNGPRPDTLTGAVNYDANRKRIGTLNPQWVEWLMGYPDGWTDCGD
jgi:hypothetical protein